jgi:hypothetical protein
MSGQDGAVGGLKIATSGLNRRMGLPLIIRSPGVTYDQLADTDLPWTDQRRRRADYNQGPNFRPGFQQT